MEQTDPFWSRLRNEIIKDMAHIQIINTNIVLSVNLSENRNRQKVHYMVQFVILDANKNKLKYCFAAGSRDRIHYWGIRT